MIHHGMLLNDRGRYALTLYISKTPFTMSVTRKQVSALTGDDNDTYIYYICVLCQCRLAPCVDGGSWSQEYYWASGEMR